ncbi:MAG: hypothetical protein YK1309IOTA_790028 [Marine Group I thaumarchaeote]|nr:MAG: hypothetical protein YK1309IOTA_790028 [Marine Group I thaumarchaeote]
MGIFFEYTKRIKEIDYVMRLIKSLKLRTYTSLLFSITGKFHSS